MTEKDSVTLCAVGDIVAFHKNTESAFEYVGEVLRKADITFAQNERHYSERTDIDSKTTYVEQTKPDNARALKLGGFDVISFASNHSMELGPDVMLETVSVLKKLGFAVIGVGRNIEESRQPVIIERKGTKVAFLAYSSVLRKGHEAQSERAGCAPMRAWTLYHQIDYQPGTPPQIITFAHKDDLQAVVQDVIKAKAQADLVVLSFHWGIHFSHALIAMYQKEVAHAVIDAGADIILGHHAHQLKGIEVYKGKPIFYSMGNFAFDLPLELLKGWMKYSVDLVNLFDHYNWELDPEWNIYTFPPESRKSMIVRCNIANKELERVSFLPVLINQKAQPHIISKQDRMFKDLYRYVEEITESQGLQTKYLVEGNEIVVSLT